MRTSPRSFSRSWLPQANFDELMIRADRDPIHRHPALHHLHYRWNMDDVLPTADAGAGTGAGASPWRSPRAWFRRYVAGIVREQLERYFVEEKSFRAAVAQSVDAVAYRVDEVSTADMKALLAAVRDDLLDLARYVDGRIESGGAS